MIDAYPKIYSIIKVEKRFIAHCSPDKNGFRQAVPEALHSRKQMFGKACMLMLLNRLPEKMKNFFRGLF